MQGGFFLLNIQSVLNHNNLVETHTNLQQIQLMILAYNSHLQYLIQINQWTQYGHGIKNSWGESRTLEPFGYEPNALTN